MNAMFKYPTIRPQLKALSSLFCFRFVLFLQKAIFIV